MELHNWGSLEEPISFLGDMEAPRLREIREIGNRDIYGEAALYPVYSKSFRCFKFLCLMSFIVD